MEVNMKKNMGSVDRTIRVIVALVIGILYLAGQITGLVALILGIVAVIFLLTSVLGFCPLYVPFKLSTKKEAAKA
jgi:Na+(H+)/acetate symporter ActP